MTHANRDRMYMAAALRLAAKARGHTSPNPMVGAVVVSGSRIVGQAYHHRAGEPHAEILALETAGTRARGATLYVTLEPCSHTRKRTPPCVPVIVASGLRRIVIAMRDPNPLVNGRAIARLRRAGIEVTVGCLGEQAQRLNEAYGHWIRTGRPIVWLKAAMTLDGQIATAAGESQWITGEAARRQVHRVRSRMDAVMVGIGTVLRDDPQLTARRLAQRGRQAAHQPLRIILDTRLRIPLTARVLASNADGRTIIATTEKASRPRRGRLETHGATVLMLPIKDGRVSLKECLSRLGQMGVTSVLLEGGSDLNATAIRSGLVNRVLLYIAPVLLGGQDATGLIGGSSPKRLDEALSLDDVRVTRVGRDYLVEGKVLA